MPWLLRFHFPSERTRPSRDLRRCSSSSSPSSTRRPARASVRRLHAYLQSFPFPSRITIADNASTDGTWAIACRLEDELRRGRLRPPGRRRDGARAPPGLVGERRRRPRLHGRRPLDRPRRAAAARRAAGLGPQRPRDRHSPRPRRQRRAGPKRELISRSLQPRPAHRARHPVQRRAVRLQGDPRATGPGSCCRSSRIAGWFFDTELLVLAERAGFRIHEVPVDWVDDADSRVDIVSTARDDLRGVWRLRSRSRAGRIDLPRRARARRRASSRRCVRFVAIGIASTVAYGLLYLALRSGMGGQAANATALLLTAIGNTAANRRYTFAIRGPAHGCSAPAPGPRRLRARARRHRRARWRSCTRSRRPPRARSSSRCWSSANLVATVLRFVLLRGWVFRERRSAPALEETADDRHRRRRRGTLGARTPARRSSAAGRTTPPGCAPRCSRLLAGTALLYLSASRRERLGELVLQRSRAGRDPRAGRRSSSAPSTRRTSSPSTSRPPRCG